MSNADDRNVADLESRLASYMEKHGLRSTSQRRLVADVFFRSQGHFSIDDMLAMVKERDPKVGYATVYRTLKLLQECGLANERRFRDGVTRYEISTSDEHHDHLICVECSRIVEFEDEDIERWQERVAKRLGFKLVSHKHELYGICENCQQARAI